MVFVMLLADMALEGLKQRLSECGKIRQTCSIHVRSLVC